MTVRKESGFVADRIPPAGDAPCEVLLAIGWLSSGRLIALSRDGLFAEIELALLPDVPRDEDAVAMLATYPIFGPLYDGVLTGLMILFSPIFIYAGLVDPGRRAVEDEFPDGRTVRIEFPDGRVISQRVSWDLEAEAYRLLPFDDWRSLTERPFSHPSDIDHWVRAALVLNRLDYARRFEVFEHIDGVSGWTLSVSGDVIRLYVQDAEDEASPSEDALTD